MVTLGILFWFLNQRVENLTTQYNHLLSNQEVLRDNQETIENDFKKVVGELQSLRKEVPIFKKVANDVQDLKEEKLSRK